MHYVSKISAAAALTPKIYDQVSTGFRRATYVDHTTGSVHMGVGICYLAPNGFIEPHLHSFEESFYVLEGTIRRSAPGLSLPERRSFPQTVSLNPIFIRARTASTF